LLRNEEENQQTHGVQVKDTEWRKVQNAKDRETEPRKKYK